MVVAFIMVFIWGVNKMILLIAMVYLALYIGFFIGMIVENVQRGR